MRNPLRLLVSAHARPRSAAFGLLLCLAVTFSAACSAPGSRNANPAAPSAVVPSSPTAQHTPDGDDAQAPGAESGAQAMAFPSPSPTDPVNSGPAVIGFPPRNEPNAFFQDLTVYYRDVLRRPTTATYVDGEGENVWLTEYFRFSLNGCSHAESVAKTLREIQFGGTEPICGKETPTFPPRNLPFEFQVQLEATYRDVLRRPAIQAYVDSEGANVWLAEYLRYRVSSCDHSTARIKVLTEIGGGGVQAPCSAPVAAPTPTPAPTPSPTPTRIISVIVGTDGFAFGNVNIGATADRHFFVKNNGNSTLRITAVTPVSTNSAGILTEFVVSDLPRLPFDLCAGCEELGDLSFAPIRSGAYEGELVFSGNQTSGTSRIPFSGSGTFSSSVPLLINDVSPETSVAAGGRTVTLSGQGFVDGSRVGFGFPTCNETCREATNVQVTNGGTTITLRTPPFDVTPGGRFVEIQVLNPNGQKATLSGRFRFTAADPFPEGKLASLTWAVALSVTAGSVQVGSTYNYTIVNAPGAVGPPQTYPAITSPASVVTSCCNSVSGYTFTGVHSVRPAAGGANSDEFELRGTIRSDDGRTITGTWLNNRKNQQGTFVMTAVAPFGEFNP